METFYFDLTEELETARVPGHHGAGIIACCNG